MNPFNLSFLDSSEDVISNFLHTQVLLGPLVLLLIEEMGVPLPVPGDVTIAFIGYEASQGLISYPVAFLILLVAVLVGSSVLFYLSSRFGQRVVLKIGKYIHVNEEKLLLVERNFKKYGPLVIIFGRHIPALRVPITVFAGISGVSYKTFILSTFVSVIPWIAFYLWLGAKLGNKVKGLFSQHHGFILLFTIPIAIALILAIWRALRTERRKKE